MRILHDFSYERPKSLKEALKLLEAHGAALSPLAGGTDLVVNMKMRGILQITEKAGTADARWRAARRVQPIQTPSVVMSLADLPKLRGVRKGKGLVRIGPTTTMAELAAPGALPPALAAVGDAAAIMGSALIRNRATIGGNVVNARPAADTAVALLAAGAKLRLAARSGEREVEIAAFFTGPGRSVRRADELLVLIEAPAERGQGSAYVRMGSRRQLEIALVSAGAWLEVDKPTRTIRAARISLGAVGPTPLLATKAAAGLVGRTADPEAFAAAGRTARAEVKPIDDFRGSAAYRLELVETLVQRALAAAASRAVGKGGRR
ncbi:MAG: FAD binding domain-containing protein [Proteobacteria bacterium]|jgi:carbon-monoxide dehydrogenase medium subunit|nr:FAD binding domain-containing protein [Pseudomonadota bacterium]